MANITNSLLLEDKVLKCVDKGEEPSPHAYPFKHSRDDCRYFRADAPSTKSSPFDFARSTRACASPAFNATGWECDVLNKRGVEDHARLLYFFAKYVLPRFQRSKGVFVVVGVGSADIDNVDVLQKELKSAGSRQSSQRSVGHLVVPHFSIRSDGDWR
jgi:hypothetical protein